MKKHFPSMGQEDSFTAAIRRSLLMSPEDREHEANEPSRHQRYTRPANELLIRCRSWSIPLDPLPGKILGWETKKRTCFNLRANTFGQIGVCQHRDEGRMGRCFVQGCRKRMADRHPGAETRHFRPSGIPLAQARSRILRCPPRRSMETVSVDEDSNRTSARLLLVPVDFERDDVGEKLVRSRISAELASRFFIGSGLCHIFHRDAIGATLDYIVVTPELEVVFDYWNSRGILRRAKALRNGAAEKLKKLMNVGSVSAGWHCSKFFAARILLLSKNQFQEIAQVGRDVQDSARTRWCSCVHASTNCTRSYSAIQSQSGHTDIRLCRRVQP